MSRVNVALIGYAFMGKAHSNAYRQVQAFMQPEVEPHLKVICGRTEENVRAAAQRYGWEEYSTDWREVLGRSDIDVIDIVTPGDSHCEIALAAAEAGKVILCEKPLANTLSEAEQDVRCCRGGRSSSHDLPQLSESTGCDAGPPNHRGRSVGRDLSLSRHLPAGLDRGPGVSPGVEASKREGRLGRPGRHPFPFTGPLEVSGRGNHGGIFDAQDLHPGKASSRRAPRRSGCIGGTGSSHGQGDRGRCRGNPGQVRQRGDRNHRRQPLLSWPAEL